MPVPDRCNDIRRHKTTSASRGPSVDASAALAFGLPCATQEAARVAGEVFLLRRGRPNVRLYLTRRAARNGGLWYATVYDPNSGDTLNAYVGAHRPRRSNRPALSAAGIAHALEGIDRQLEGAWRVPRCQSCGRRLHHRL